jgi:uncharacterized protein
MECRAGCGACCIAPSIGVPIPGMPGGKPPGTPCANLDTVTYECRIWNSPDYPSFCRGLQPSLEMCGLCRDDALVYLAHLEEITRPE